MQNTTTRTTAGNPAERLLCRCACVALDDAAGEAIRGACREQQDGSRTIRKAGLHGVAPWLHMRRAPISFARSRGISSGLRVLLLPWQRTGRAGR